MVHTTFNLVFMTDPKVIGRRFEFKNQPPKKLGVIIYTVYDIFYLHCVRHFLIYDWPNDTWQ